MTSAASAARIPYKHSAAAPPTTTTTTAPHHGQDPRCATSLHHATCHPDVAAVAADNTSITTNQAVSSGPSTPSVPAPITHSRLASAPPAVAGKVDSQTVSSTPSVKSLRNHSRLASFGRIRSRGSIQASLKQQPALPGETPPAPVPVSPSDAGSHKRSDASQLSSDGSDTTVSDDCKADDPKPSFFRKPSLAASQVSYDQSRFDENYSRLVAQQPRTMHQTSSKLLRMTEDDRPFTRVCICRWFHTRCNAGQGG